ncbi:MAG: hypothetical protein M0R77_00850 [Gammaproteobacteria bacterium]|nr:hypothetical protein [Acholeplasmataceae bacterium]MCK9529103.1 hypothetical protein [Gammaproteobacteria bacterium]
MERFKDTCYLLERTSQIEGLLVYIRSILQLESYEEERFIDGLIDYSLNSRFIRTQVNEEIVLKFVDESLYSKLTLNRSYLNALIKYSRLFLEEVGKKVSGLRIRGEYVGLPVEKRNLYLYSRIESNEFIAICEIIE